MTGYATSECTPTKDRHFSEILATHLAITKAVIKKYPNWANPVYHYFDLNAGPGIDEHGREGSPIIFLKQIHYYNLLYQAKLFEKNKSTAAKLMVAIGDNAEVLLGDHYETFPQFFNSIANNIYGLVYSDPSGNIPPFDLIGEWSSYPAFHRTDVLIYISSANLKRALKSSKCHHNMRLTESIKLINKRYWIVREPQDKHQWTFLLGTNWTNFPAFERIGFYKADGQRGKEIMAKLSYTNEERKNGTF